MKSFAKLDKLHLIFFSLFAVALYAQQQKDGWFTWTSGDRSVSVSYPKEWSELKLNAGEIIAFAAPKTDAKDSYPDMLILRSFPDSGIKNIDRLKNFARNTLSPDWNFKMVSSRKITAAGKEYIQSVAEDSKKNVVLLMYTMLKADKIFFLTLNVEKRNYEKYKPVGERVFDSLVISQAWIAK
jgi:hypothetical protein